MADTAWKAHQVRGSAHGPARHRPEQRSPAQHRPAQRSTARHHPEQRSPSKAEEPSFLRRHSGKIAAAVGLAGLAAVAAFAPAGIVKLAKTAVGNAFSRAPTTSENPDWKNAFEQGALLKMAANKKASFEDALAKGKQAADALAKAKQAADALAKGTQGYGWTDPRKYKFWGGQGGQGPRRGVQGKFSAKAEAAAQPLSKAKRNSRRRTKVTRPLATKFTAVRPSSVSGARHRKGPGGVSGGGGVMKLPVAKRVFNVARLSRSSRVSRARLHKGFGGVMKLPAQSAARRGKLAGGKGTGRH